MNNRILFLIIFLLFAVHSFSQRQDTLFWFVGKWQPNKTFKIDSSLMGGKGGGMVNIKPDGTIDIQTGDNKAWNQKIDEQVKEIDKDEEKINSDIKQGEGLYQFHLAEQIDRQLENEKKTFQSYKSEPIKNDEDILKIRTAQLHQNVSDACIRLKPRYMQIMDFVKQHKKDKKFDLPAPPVADYTCWMCDKDKRDQYDTTVAHWVEDYFREDAGMIKDALSMLRDLTLLGFGTSGNVLNNPGSDNSNLGIDDLFNENRRDPSRSGVCAYMKTNELGEAVMEIMLRAVRKAEQLFHDNRTNYYALTPVIKVYLQTLRDAQLLGLNPNEDNAMAEIGASLQTLYEKERDKLLKDKDFAQIGNIPLILGIARQVALLGSNTSNDGDIDKILNFLHFKLTFEMDLKVGKNGGYMIAHYKGTAKMVAELDSAKCITFQLDKAEQANFHADLITNEMVAPGPHPVYVGTRKGKSPLPNINLHFCRPGIDTVKMAYLQADGSAIWNIPNARPMIAFMLVNEAMFKNPDQAVDEAMEIKNNEGEITKELKMDEAEVRKKIAEMQRSGKSPQEMAAEMKKIMEMGQSQPVQTVTALGSVILPITVHNKSSVLIDQRFDAKQMNPAAAQAIVYGYLNLKFEHDPKK